MRIRNAKKSDIDYLYKLYVSVANKPGGLARERSEINIEYIRRILYSAIEMGIMLVIENEKTPEQLIAAIHAYKLEPKVFSHVLSELTILVHPDFQKKGIGKTIFQAFLDVIMEKHHKIMRVELIARESNHHAIFMYESLGFVKEGRLENRIRSIDGNLYEADIILAWMNPRFVSA